jgi:lysophospholipase
MSTETTQRKHTKILIIHTGGTLGMLPNHEGPAPGYLAKQIEGSYRFNDPNAQKKQGFKFATPVSKYNSVGYFNIIEFDPLQNSVNISFKDWNKLALCIKENYEKYDAFIIIHGTDTMCFTASALSFMLENLHKTIIVTGSLIPISKIMSDGKDNLLGALDIAMHFVIPEVCIYSYTHLYRANRTTRVNTVGFKIFKSPNFPPLGKAGVELYVEWSLLRGCNSEKPLIVHPITNPNVGCIQLFPGITKDIIQNFLRKPMAGVILQSYG